MTEFLPAREVYKLMQPGDLLEFDRTWYKHWAVVADSKQIIHLAGEVDEMKTAGINGCSQATFKGAANKAKVTLSDFWSVVEGSLVRIANAPNDSKYSKREIVRRAMSKLGEKGYSLIWKNCEHFANWCRYDREKSQQVSNTLTAVAGTAVLAGLAGLGAWALSDSDGKSGKK